MEKTVQVIMTDVKDHMRNHSTDRDCLQLNSTPSQSSRPFAQLSRDDLLADCSNLVSTYSPSADLLALGPMEEQVEYKSARFIWQVCPVILFLFGTAGNILTLMMLRRLRLGRTSMHIYLRALAISDLCVLYTGLLRQWIHWLFQLDLRDQHTFLCKVHTWMVYVSLYVSAWLLVFMTLERTCSACMPHRVSTFCTKSRACFLIAFVVILLSSFESHFLFGMTVKEDNGTKMCVAISEEYSYFIHDIMPLVDIILISLLPFAFVIIGNTIIVWKTFVSLKTAAELNLASGKSAILRKRRASSMTVILLILSALFLFTTSPTCVYNIWERGSPKLDPEKHPVAYARMELAWALVNIVMYCNNTFNFYLYCLSGRKFRNEVRRQFSRRRTDSQSIVMSAPSVQITHRYPMNDFTTYNGLENGHSPSPTPSPHLTVTFGRNSNSYL